MVKLPSLELPTNRSVGAGRTPTVSPADATQSIKAAGDILKTASKFVEEQHKSNLADQALEEDNAWKKELFETDTSFDDRTDYEVHQQEHDIKTKAMMDQRLARIPDRELRRDLQGRWDSQRMSSNRQIYRNADKGQKDQRLGRLQKSIGQTRDLVGSVKYPREKVPGLIAEQIDNIDGYVASREISAAEGQRLKEKVINDLVKTWHDLEKVTNHEGHEAFLGNLIKAKKSGALDAYSTRTSNLTGRITSGVAKRPAYGWAKTNKTWQGLGPFERAAAMSLMEANGMRVKDAKNVLGAMINRAANEGEDLGAHVSGEIYEPTRHQSQEARLNRILRSKEYKELLGWAKKRASGEVPDPVKGATHFLASEKTMLDLQRKNPDLYHNWGPFKNSRGVPGKNWTGYNPETRSYEGVVARDGSHAFLAPDGKFNGVVGDGGQAGPKDEQNLVPLPPQMVVGNKITEHLSDVEIQELYEDARREKRGKNLEKYADDTESLKGAIDRIRRGGVLTPEDKAQLKEIEARWIGLGPQYEQRFNGFANKIEESQYYRGALNGKDTISKDISLDGMTAEEMKDHFDTLRKRAAKGKLRDQAIQSRAIDDAVREAKDVLEKRAKDPAASVLKIPAVQEADQDLEQIEGQIVEAEGAFDEARLRLLRRQQIEARLAAQQEVLVATPRAITKSEAKQTYPFVKSAGTDDQFEDLIEKYYLDAVERYGDNEIASKVVSDAYALQVKGPKTERQETFEYVINRMGDTEFTQKDIRQLERVTRDAERYNPDGTRRDAGPRPLPTEAEQKVLRERAGDPNVVEQFRRDYGDKAALDVLYGKKIEPRKEVQKEAKAETSPADAPISYPFPGPPGQQSILSR